MATLGAHRHRQWNVRVRVELDWDNGASSRRHANIHWWGSGHLNLARRSWTKDERERQSNKPRVKKGKQEEEGIRAGEGSAQQREKTYCCLFNLESLPRKRILLPRAKIQ